MEPFIRSSGNGMTPPVALGVGLGRNRLDVPPGND
jgi:hypothetical protein